MLRSLYVLALIVPTLAIPVRAQPFFDAPWRAFQTSGPEEGDFPVALAAGDLDGDGLPDAIVGQNVFDAGLRVLSNEGTAAGRPATFGESVFYPTDRGVFDIAVADLDGDGDLDLAASDTDVNYSTNGVVVLLNDGDGTFDAPQTYPAGDATTGVTAADLDGDGDLDLAVTNYGFFGQGTEISVLMNDGSGAFGAPTAYTVAESHARVASGDLDGDGDADLAVAHDENRVTMLFNDGDGTFGSVVLYDDLFPVVNTAAFSDVALLDPDADGDLDVAFTSNTLYDQDQDEPLLVLLRNDGPGTLTPELHYYGIPFENPAYDLTATDLDGDGRDDLIGGQAPEVGYVVLRDDDADGFLAAELYASVRRGDDNSGVAATAATDLDGDGDPDALTVGRIRRLLAAHENLGDGTFPERPIYGRGFVHTVLDLGDVDGDGDVDAATSHAGASQSTVTVHLGGNDGTFTESYSTPESLYGFAKLRDLDGDGHLDLLFVTGPGAGAQIPYDFFTARGNGDGTFEEVVQWPVGACGLAHPGAFDLDGDGDLDVVLTENLACMNIPESGQRLFINLNNGDGTFEPPSVVFAGAFPYNLAAGDFDEDGHLDLATSSQGASALLFGNGDGTFQPEQPLPSGTLGANILALDLDADGHLDLATLDMFSPDGTQGDESMLSVLLGDGTGAFTETEYPEHLTQGFREWVAAGDVDGDGDPDLLAGGVQDGLVFLNDGAGAFAFSGRYGLGAGGYSLHYAEANGDEFGDLLALVTHEDPPAGTEQGIVVVPGLTGLPVASEGAGTPSGAQPGPSVLSEVYPNPFGASARVALDVAETQRVTVAVYDVLGRRVAVLLDDRVEARVKHRLTFEASGLPSGLYVVRVAGETFSATRLATLLR